MSEFMTLEQFLAVKGVPPAVTDRSEMTCERCDGRFGADKIIWNSEPDRFRCIICSNASAWTEVRQ